MNNKQIVVTGLKDMVIRVDIGNACITWTIVNEKEVTKKLRFQKPVEFFYIRELQRTKEFIKMTPVASVKSVKHDIGLNRTVSVQYGSGGSKIWI